MIPVRNQIQFSCSRHNLLPNYEFCSDVSPKHLAINMASGVMMQIQNLMKAIVYFVDIHKITFQIAKMKRQSEESDRNGGNVNESSGDEEEINFSKIKLNVDSVHLEFTQLEESNAGVKVIYSQCNHCTKKVKGKNSTNLLKHINSFHKNVYKSVLESNLNKKKELFYSRDRVPKTSLNKNK